MRIARTVLILFPWLLASADVGAAAAKADAALQVVDGAAPLKLSAPADWEIQVHAPQKKQLATVATLSQRCMSGEVHTVFIQLDEEHKTPEALLGDQFPDAKPKKMGAWSCTQANDHEAMCAGRVKGLKGLVAVYLASMSGKAFSGIGGLGFVARIASSVGWKGGTPDKIPEWSRNGAPAIDVKCPE